MDSTPRILIVRFGAMGDLLLTTPLIRAIRHRYPHSDLTVTTLSRYAPLIAANPHISRVEAYDPVQPWLRFARQLAKRSFTHRLDLHRSLRSRWLRLHLGGRWTTYPKYRVARTALIRWKVNRYRDQRPIAERYFDAARPLGVEPDGMPAEVFLHGEDLEEARARLRAGGHREGEPLLVFAPGAAHPTKRWPVTHWARLTHLTSRDPVRIAVVGGTGERDVGSLLQRQIPDRVVDLTGTLPIRTTAAVLKLARTVVAGDTGLLHLATAVGTPVVGLFGPTVKAFGFFPYRARGVVLEEPLGCRPCSAHGGASCPLDHHRCLNDLEPTRVAEAIGRLGP